MTLRDIESEMFVNTNEHKRRGIETAFKDSKILLDHRTILFQSYLKVYRSHLY
jgi:hypothetical protein